MESEAFDDIVRNFHQEQLQLRLAAERRKTFRKWTKSIFWATLFLGALLAYVFVEI